jgi:hypothetical protein
MTNECTRSRNTRPLIISSLAGTGVIIDPVPVNGSGKVWRKA